MKRIGIIFIICCFGVTVFAQTIPGLKTVVTSLNNFSERMAIEKLYLQTDKPYYNSGDTIHFKAYLFANDLTASTRSRMLYIELDDVAGKMVKRIMIPAAWGIGWGDIALEPENISQGSYTLRAYTNWMRNFGEDHIFKKNIYISSTSSASTLIKADFKLSDKGDKTNIQANLRFTGLSRMALGLRDMKLWVKAGRKNLIKDNAITGIDGTMNVNFDLADKTMIKNLYIQAQYTSKDADTAMLTIPVIINRPENTDLQFMPEGGDLVAGMATKVGFKAIGEDGKGTEVSGKIYNSKQQEVTDFQSTHKGMGSFEFTPQAGETYTAKVTLTGNVIKNYPLPAVNPSGTSLKVTTNGTDSLELVINATPGIGADKSYYLLGLTKGIVSYSTELILNKSRTIIRIPKNKFATGITHFTLLTSANQPLNERLVYIDHNDNLNITIKSTQETYLTRDSIALAVLVRDKAGKPVQGTFSMAVTDNAQVRPDSIGSNIINSLLVTSDLKGTVEEPAYYFENNTPERLADLDNLLLTQGWVGYNWKDIFGPKTQPKFIAEKEFTVEGRVINFFNRPVDKAGIVLFSQKPTMVRDTVTDKDGKFTFKGFFPVDTATYKIQARNKSGQSFNVGIEMLNEFKPLAFGPNRAIAPWYVNADTLLLNNTNTKISQLNAEANYRGEGHMLKQVEIKAVKIVKDSKNLNGPGEADLVIDEQEILKAGKATLGDLLKAKIKGFKIKGTWDKCTYFGRPCPINTSYLVNENMIHFIIDGTELEFVERGELEKDPDRYATIKHYMDYFSAEDIKGIELMTNVAYVSNYAAHYLGGGGPLPPIVFIEITTRGGKGPWMKVTPGTYLYKPLPFTLPKQFYRPRYTARNINAAQGLDMRSTIHWQPNIVTDATGRATVSFFSADKTTDYTVTMEGSDMEGQLGYQTKKIKIIPPPSPNPDNNKLRNIAVMLDSFRNKAPEEKVYLHMDKSYYSLGDTVWMKAYTVNETNGLSDMSKLVYIDLVNDKDSVKRTLALPLTAGLGWGALTLNDSLRAGSYHIRAYTNWMRNFGEEYYFDKAVRIGNALPVAVVPPAKKSPAKVTSVVKPALQPTIKTNPPETSVQFFPESGELVNGLTSKIAFKVMGTDGLGKEITGSIVDKNNQEITTFKTEHAGMGAFILQPIAGNLYTAIIKQPDGTEKRIELPKANEQGYNLSVTQDEKNLIVKIEGTPGVTRTGEISLVIQANNKVEYTGKKELMRSVLLTTIPKTRFPEGVLQLTLFSPQYQPVAERLIFIRRDDRHLKVTITPDKPGYKQRDKTHLDLQVTDQDGMPVIGAFSLAVTDNGKAPIERSAETTIFSSLLLSADLKGYIEQPNYYFTDTATARQQQLDNLLLTQGWRKFTWKNVLAGTNPNLPYKTETIMGISGRILTNNNIPAAGAKVSLLVNIGGGIIMDTVTNAKGRFAFAPPGLKKGDKFNLTAEDKNKNKDVKIEIDAPEPPQLTYKHLPDAPVSKNFDTYMESSHVRFDELKKNGLLNGINLKEVVISEKKKPLTIKEIAVQNSSNLAGPGNADQVLTFIDLRACPYELSKCLQGRVISRYGLESMYVIVDGMPGRNLRDVMSADVASVEVLRGGGASSLYGMHGSNGIIIVTTKQPGVDYAGYVAEYLHPGSTKAKGLVSYKFEGGADLVRQFYSPDYVNPNLVTPMADLRSTVYWNPDIITDEQGKASVEFFNADGMGNYRVVVQGLEPAGKLGWQEYTYTVGQK